MKHKSRRIIPSIAKVLVFALIMVSCTTYLVGCSSGSQESTTSGHLTHIKKSGVMIVGTSTPYEPFEYINEKGDYQGFDIDLIEEIGKRMGVTIEYVDMGFDELLPALSTDEIDVAIACIAPTSKRLETAEFTEPYVQNRLTVMAATEVNLQSSSDLVYHTLAVKATTVAEEWVYTNLVEAKNTDEHNILIRGSHDEIVNSVIAGRAELAILDAAVAKRYADQSDLTPLLEIEVDHNPAIAVAKGQTALLEELNQVIAELTTEGFIDELRVNWLR